METCVLETTLGKRRHDVSALRAAAAILCFHAFCACVSLPPSILAELRPAEAGQANHFKSDENKKIQKDE